AATCCGSGTRSKPARSATEPGRAVHGRTGTAHPRGCRRRRGTPTTKKPRDAGLFRSRDGKAHSPFATTFFTALRAGALVAVFAVFATGAAALPVALATALGRALP